jgi:hypothetical protein
MYSGIQISLMLLWQFGISPTADRFKGPVWLARLLKTTFMLLTFLSGFVAIGGTGVTRPQIALLNTADIEIVAADIGLTNNCLCYIPVSHFFTNIVTSGSGSY